MELNSEDGIGLPQKKGTNLKNKICPRCVHPIDLFSKQNLFFIKNLGELNLKCLQKSDENK